MPVESRDDLVGKWSCEERSRKNCRNPFGCHCREITSLIAARESDAKRIAELERKHFDADDKRCYWQNRAETAERALAEETERHQWRTIDSAPKDRVIFVRRDNGCGTDYEVVWWNDHRSDGYPWRSEFNAYPENRWDEWFDATAIRSGKPDGKE